MNEPLVKIPCRLAIRHEGDFVNAYMALDDTMQDAKLLGSILCALVDANPELFEQWKNTMRTAMALIVKSIFGANPVWGGEEKAPEHERAGQA